MAEVNVRSMLPGKGRACATPGSPQPICTPALREEAVAAMGLSQIGEVLSEAQIADIAAFLGTPTGEVPEVGHPILPQRTAPTPLPRIR